MSCSAPACALTECVSEPCMIDDGSAFVLRALRAALHGRVASSLSRMGLNHQQSQYHVARRINASMPAAVMALQAEVKRHEPHEALDGGGQDGLPAVDSVCRAALRLLKPGGFLAIETGGER